MNWQEFPQQDPELAALGAGAAGTSWPGDVGDPAEEWVASDIAGGAFVL